MDNTRLTGTGPSFWRMTGIFTVGLPLFFTTWPIASEFFPIVVFDANFIAILPIALWMRHLLKKSDDLAKDMVALFIAVIAMCVAIYFLVNANPFMHPRFEPLGLVDRFRTGACWSAFIYAGGLVLVSGARLFGHVLNR